MDYKQTDFSKFGADCFPGLLGIEVLNVSTNIATAQMEVKRTLFAPNGYLHAGSVVTLADTIAGYACLYNLPMLAKSFTTIELKSNFLGSTKKWLYNCRSKFATFRTNHTGLGCDCEK